MRERPSYTQLCLAHSAEDLWSTEQVFEVLSKSGFVGNLQEARAQLEKDGKLTTEQVFEIMSRADFSGTLTDAKVQLANKRRGLRCP